MKLQFLVLIVCLAAACSSPAPTASSVTAIVGATLIDGTDALPVSDAVVLVADGTIVAAGPRADTEIPAGAETIDATGKTIIPGLIELHAHYAPFAPSTQAAKRDLGFQLAYGVTTARSIGLDTAETIAAIEEVRSGSAPGPRVFTAGRGFTAPGGVPRQYGFGQPRQPETPEQARQEVRELAAQDVDFIKVWVDSAGGTIERIRPEILEAIVDEAGKHRIPIVAHIKDRESLDELLALGVSDFLHSLGDQDPADAEFVQALKRHQASFAPTLAGHELAWLLAENPELVGNDREFQAVLEPETIANVADPAWRKELLAAPDLDTHKAALAQAQQFVAQLHSEGVVILVGSDCGVPLIPQGWGTHHEMRLLAEAGIEPLDVIRMATGDAAKQLGWTEFGTIEPGAAADLVVLDADPLDDINNTRKISRVMQAGEWIDREALLGL